MIRLWILRWVLKDFYATCDWQVVVRELFAAHCHRYPEENEPTSVVAIASEVVANTHHCKDWVIAPKKG